MVALVVAEEDGFAFLGEGVEDDLLDTFPAAGGAEGDVVGGVAEAVVHGHGGPGGRQAGDKAQTIDFQFEADEMFED